MMQMATIVEELFVWNFEFGHWDLFVIWFLVLGILMIFKDYHSRWDVREKKPLRL
jgi:hypothetical protein